MRLNLITKQGNGLGMATHLSSEGHSVSVFHAKPSTIGQGILEVNVETIPGVADIYIYDNPAFGQHADHAREEGVRVLGASRWAQMVEDDASYQNEIIKLVGWEAPKSLSGVNLYITGWFNGAKFVSSYVSLVYRRLMSGGAGPDIGCMGTVSNFHQPTEKIYNTFLKPLEKTLRRVNHRGCIHIHSVVNGEEHGVSGLSTNFSHPLTYALLENVNLPVSNILLRLFDETSKPIRPLEQWASGVVLSVPPYPYTNPHSPVDLKGLRPSNLKHMWLCDALKEDNLWKTTGETGLIGLVTARGSSVEESTRRAYRTISQLEIKDLQYRSDVGRNINPILTILSKSGWIKR